MSARRSSKPITPAQSRAARGLLRWSTGDLARETGLHEQTIETFENDRPSTMPATISRLARQAIYDVLTAAGVTLIHGKDGAIGVSLKESPRGKKPRISPGISKELSRLLAEWDSWVTRNLLKTTKPTRWHVRAFVAVLKKRHPGLTAFADLDTKLSAIEEALRRHRNVLEKY